MYYNAPEARREAISAHDRIVDAARDRDGDRLVAESIATGEALERLELTLSGRDHPKQVVPPAGLEPAPRGLKGRRSNQLSYRGERPSSDGGGLIAAAGGSARPGRPGAARRQERSGMPS